MLRNLIIIAAIIIVFMILRKRFAGSGKPDKISGTSASTQMVQCQSCDTYVPENEAVREGKHFFCCQQHLRDWSDKAE